MVWYIEWSVDILYTFFSYFWSYFANNLDLLTNSSSSHRREKKAIYHGLVG